MHQSGGCIFDRGGINNLGFGYRCGFCPLPASVGGERRHLGGCLRHPAGDS